jgi:hypothetical protein
MRSTSFELVIGIFGNLITKILGKIPGIAAFKEKKSWFLKRKETKKSKSLPKQTVIQKFRLSFLTVHGINFSGVNDFPKKTHSQRPEKIRGLSGYERFLGMQLIAPRS